MRVFFGIILGALLTVAVAFITDNWRTNPTNTAADQRVMVNWDVVGENLRGVRHRAHEVWTKLSQKVAS
jgi:hypothetical protein